MVNEGKNYEIISRINEIEILKLKFEFWMQKKVKL
jgi:hypothetical protein